MPTELGASWDSFGSSPLSSPVSSPISSPSNEDADAKRRKREKKLFQEQEAAQAAAEQAKLRRRANRRRDRKDKRRVMDDGTEILTINGGGEVFVKTHVPAYERGSWDISEILKWSETRSAVSAHAHATLMKLIDMNRRLKESDESQSQQVEINREMEEAREEIAELQVHLEDLLDIERTRDEMGKNRPVKPLSERDLEASLERARMLKEITTLNLRTVIADKPYQLKPLRQRRDEEQHRRVQAAIDADELVEEDEERAPRPQSAFRGLCHDLVYHPNFEPCIALVIGVNLVLTIAALSSEGGAHQRVFGVLEDLFTAIFIMEAAAKIVAMGLQMYFDSNWNKFDFTLVCVSVVSKMIEIFLDDGVLPVPPTVARVARALRVASRVVRVAGRSVRLVRVWLHKWHRDQLRKRNQMGILRSAMNFIHRSLGANVGILFVFYQKVFLANLVMLALWLGLAIVPFCLGPPAGFDWNQQSYKGTVGEDDPALETSFFYLGAYTQTHHIGGYSYKMDIAYVACVLLMFAIQVGGLVFGISESCEDTLVLEDKPPDAFRLLLGSFEHAITNEGMIVCNVDSLQRKVKRLADFGTLEKETWLLPTSALAVLGRITGVTLYLGLFPLSYLAMHAIYQNNSAISGASEIFVPLMIALIRVAVPMYLVPKFVMLESWQEHQQSTQVILRTYLLAMFNVNALLFVLQNAPLPTPDGKNETCRQIFIAKVYWRQELMDLALHLIIDAYCTFQRWKSRPRPVFDADALAERATELLYRQALIWCSSPYSPMMCLLGLVSTAIMFGFQLFTVSISFEPPTFGWGGTRVLKLFYQALLLTFIFAFVPTLQFLHSKHSCGPFKDSDSVYKHMVHKVEHESPDGLQAMLKWLANPATTWPLLIVAVVSALYSVKMFRAAHKGLERISQSAQDEIYDKTQLMRAQNLLR